ncbi:hypothetical protein [Streptomyces sp. SCL15-6]|nr:hypothetical protein [Streptomyces sp. SCL15-6]
MLALPGLRTGQALRHYHSLHNARDLDVVRAALGGRDPNPGPEPRT